MRTLEAGIRLREALVDEDDVLRVELTCVAEEAGLAAALLDVGGELVDLRIREERLHVWHQRHRVDEARVVEMRPLPVVRMPAGLLRKVGASALGSEQVGRLIAAPEVARLRHLRVEEVQRLSHVLRPRVAGMADVAAVLREEVATLDRNVGQRGPVGRRRRIERVNRKPHDDRNDDEERDQTAQPRHEGRDQHALSWVPDPAAWQLRRAVPVSA